MELRNLPSVDELARGVDDPLAVDAARAVLANIAFLLNAFNLLPIGFLDGGQVVRAAEEAWRMPVIRFEGGVPMEALRPNRAVAVLIVSAYVAVAALLVLGMWQTHVPQHRL